VGRTLGHFVCLGVPVARACPLEPPDVARGAAELAAAIYVETRGNRPSAGPFA